ncbi:DUF6301 family protein [Actinoplanes derwentensis]|uniref:Uncharacterized protein n=1 Tax=Actinoplanes derwentensis TaxID=113562 RepID=A0A1H1VW87_9ACTN|nr:hypothetical protein [Actinoplanes derwentensis]GID83957.1 hypothetical protein Ade03nite_28810 [Actinoplanes derwentensis]SDS88751.1 hypothetical protein SAMN04489716_1892 [Actinoplanes derwentensis]
MIQDVAGPLAGQDFGRWSRADVERVAGAVGWSVQDGDHHLTVDTRSPLRARSTKIGYGQDAFGYGEQIDFQVTETCPADELAALHAATLASVADVLGPPALVGGPGAWAFWREPRVRVERHLRRCLVTVRVEPAGPAEHEEHSTAEWSPDWEPTDLWYAEPDVHSAACRSLGGMMFHDARNAATWAEFEQSVRELFVSFAADLPALAGHVSHVAWDISPEAGDREVQGVFNESGARVCEIVFGVTETADYTRLPPGSGSGARVAEIALDIIRGWDLDSPERLRHYCYTPAPGRITARSGFRIDG